MGRGTSLAVQWLGICLPMQGVQVWCLVMELRSQKPPCASSKCSKRIGWKCFSSRDDAGSFLLAACLPSRQSPLGSWDSGLSHVAPSNIGFSVSESDGERLKTSPLRLKKPLDFGRSLSIESWGWPYWESWLTFSESAQSMCCLIRSAPASPKDE